MVVQVVSLCVYLGSAFLLCSPLPPLAAGPKVALWKKTRKSGGRYYWKWMFTLPEFLSLSGFFNLIFMWLSEDSCWWVSLVSEHVMNRGFDCLCSRLVVSNLLGTRDQLHGR